MKNLTKIELKISKLVYKGLTNKEISEKLNMSIHTVKSHLEDIYDKLGVHSRVMLAVKMFNEKNYL